MLRLVMARLYLMFSKGESKDHPDGNAVTAWKKLKNKYKPVSAPSTGKLDKHFRYSYLRILKFRTLSWKTFVSGVQLSFYGIQSST
jgi:hypothetical protein